MKQFPLTSLNFAFLALMVFSSQKALAWGNLGHTIIGQVAEENLKPTTKAFVRGILGIEPLGVAATWADSVRDDEAFGHKSSASLPEEKNDHNFSNYHFVNVPTGYTYETRPLKDVKDSYGALMGSIKILKDTANQYSRTEKILAMRYLIHIMGDIHQPLHVGNGYDIGGNVCKIKWQPDAGRAVQAMNLHALWDTPLVEALGDSYALTSANKKPVRYAPDFLADFKSLRPEMFTAQAKIKYASGSVSDWVTDSVNVRENGVYPDEAAALVNVPKGEEYKHRPYCLWFISEAEDRIAPGSVVDVTKIPLLGPEYAARFTPIVEMQLLKGGLRLAQTLDDIADSVANASHDNIDESLQEKILKTIQDIFKTTK